MDQRGSLKGSKKYIELNENENTTCQSLQNTAKGMLRKKFVALNAYIGKEEKS